MFKRKIDKVLNKIEWKVLIPLLSRHRRKKLKTTEFTIISNNCWGGRVYEYFNIKKKSPTVGSYFFADDYVRFCSHLEFYLSQELVLINVDQSKHKNELYAKGEQNVLVGKLGDIEVILLHYHDPDEAIAKWKRRIMRIKWNNIILKFSYQNNCSDELVSEFLNIPTYKKIVLVGDKKAVKKDVYYFSRHNGKETVDETENIDRYLNIVEIINERLEV